MELHKEHIKQKLESQSIESCLERVDALIETQDPAVPASLGIKLALLMGMELRDSLDVGALSTDLVRSWTQTLPGSIVDEAIAYARGLLLNPAELTRKIGERLFANE
jgi:hypothetical protein